MSKSFLQFVYIVSKNKIHLIRKIKVDKTGVVLVLNADGPK